MITRSQTRIEREAPGLNMLISAIDHVEKLAQTITEELAMPYDNASSDTIKEYIKITKQLIATPDNEKLRSIINDIDHQRFCFGDWDRDLSLIKRGMCYDDSRLREYIGKLESLVEHLKSTK
jgi:hypothetical protein